jgi:hypothetical protein
MTEADHLEKTGSSVITTKHGITRVEGNGVSVHFGGEDPIELKNAINAAMDQMLSHYKPRNKKTLIGEYLSEKQLSEMTLNVVLHFLYMYSNWRRTNDKYKDLELKLQPTDFDHIQANDECYWYCKSKLTGNFRVSAAALMGKTDKELRGYEVARERFANR